MKKLLLFISFVLACSAWAQELPEPSNPPQLVNDRVELFSKQQINQLKRKLNALNDSTSTQIAILVVDDLQGYDIVDYSQRVAQKWGIGQKGKDNGAIIVLKPKTTTSKGEVNIDVGYGLEPLIPDATAKRIVEKEMIPRFRQEDYFGGVNAAIDVMIGLSAGKFTADGYRKSSGGGSGAGFLVPIIVLIILLSWINRGRSRYSTYGRQSNSSLWTTLFLASMFSNSSRGSFSDFNSGSGGFGGGSGGFGGFGGGSFGGGGASGSW